MKIYTKTGDKGETSLFAGGRVPKNNARVGAYGTVDELNALLGVVRAHGVPAQADEQLALIQQELFEVGADLATPLEAKADWITRLTPEPAARLERWIDGMDAQLPALTAFILPGGTLSAAQTQLARTVCRRAERDCVHLSQQEDINAALLSYLNRLSDYLFTLARWLNQSAGVTEPQWSGKRT
jgi:cob(I)alamin adenosyltransferase